MNARRKTLAAFGIGALSVAIPALAQQPAKIWRLGFLTDAARPAALDSIQFGVFLQAMRELGYVEGRNLVIEWRFADGSLERLPDLATELVRLQVDVIVVVSTPAAVAAKNASATIPLLWHT